MTYSPFHCRTCGAAYEQRQANPYSLPMWRHPFPLCKNPVSDGLAWKELFHEKGEK